MASGSVREVLRKASGISRTNPEYIPAPSRILIGFFIKQWVKGVEVIPQLPRLFYDPGNVLLLSFRCVACRFTLLSASRHKAGLQRPVFY